MSIEYLTHRETLDRMRAMYERCERIASERFVTAEMAREFDRCCREFDRLNRHRLCWERRADIAEIVRSELQSDFLSHPRVADAL